MNKQSIMYNVNKQQPVPRDGQVQLGRNRFYALCRRATLKMVSYLIYLITVHLRESIGSNGIINNLFTVIFLSELDSSYEYYNYYFRRKYIYIFKILLLHATFVLKANSFCYVNNDLYIWKLTINIFNDNKRYKYLLMLFIITLLTIGISTTDSVSLS